MIWPHMKSLLVEYIIIPRAGSSLLIVWACRGHALPRPRARPRRHAASSHRNKSRMSARRLTNLPGDFRNQTTSAMSLRLPRSQRVEARRLRAALPTPFARSRAVGMPLVPPRTRTRDQLLPSDLPPPPFSSQHHRRWCYNCCSRTAFDLSHVVKNMLLLVLRQLFGGRLAVTTQGRPILGLLSR